MSTTWVPEACTLPTVEQPLRMAEFDELLAESVRRVEAEPGRLRLELDSSPTIAGRAAHLAARETVCCSFFTFTLTVAGGMLWLEITVPEGHGDVLDALAAHASAGARS
jgi:hypothetical protein